MTAEWPTVAKFQREIEAEMAQGALESEGIAAIVWKDDAGGMYPSFQPVEGVELRVSPEDLEEARGILAALAQSGGEAEGDEATEGEDDEDGEDDDDGEDDEDDLPAPDGGE